MLALIRRNPFYGALKEMMDLFLDRTTLNIASLVLGAIGLAVALTAYNAPEVNRAYLGVNPFAVKRDIISNRMTYLFTGAAVMAVIIQVAMAVFDLPDRIHPTAFYAWLSVACLAASIILAFALRRIGLFWARKAWFPQIIELQRDVYRSVAEVIENGGARIAQLRAGNVTDHDRESNLATARQRLEQLENLFEVPLTTINLDDRLDAIRPYFLDK